MLRAPNTQFNSQLNLDLDRMIFAVGMPWCRKLYYYDYWIISLID